MMNIIVQTDIVRRTPMLTEITPVTTDHTDPMSGITHVQDMNQTMIQTTTMNMILETIDTETEITDIVLTMTQITTEAIHR